MVTHEDFDMTNADLVRLNKMIADASEKERQRCLDIVIVAQTFAESHHASAVLAGVARKIKEGA
jgi:hypothetical protein